MIPIRAKIVGLPPSATRISAASRLAISARSALSSAAWRCTRRRRAASPVRDHRSWSDPRMADSILIPSYRPRLPIAHATDRPFGVPVEIRSYVCATPTPAGELLSRARTRRRPVSFIERAIPLLRGGASWAVSALSSRPLLATIGMLAGLIFLGHSKIDRRRH